MILSYLRTLTRPGFVIPVFFLICFTASGQPAWQESSVSAAGGSFSSRHGIADVRYNQAGLGWTNQHTISLQHAQPFMISDLTVASLAVQVPVKNGGLGAAFSSYGIRGFRQTSLWISCGMKLHPAVSAGLGLHFLNTGVSERVLFHAAISCALGIQVKLNEDLCLSGHVMHPVAWSDLDPGLDNRKMMIAAGISYTFFESATYYSDLHLFPQGYLQWCHGIEICAVKQLMIILGTHNRPWSVSGGITLKYHHWSVNLATEYCFDTGTTPSSAITYAW